MHVANAIGSARSISMENDQPNNQVDIAALPFSQACENNKQPILKVLQNELQGFSHVLEIGSGTG